MKLIRQDHKIEYIQPNILGHLEMAARNCYKSEDKITEGSAEKLISSIIKKGHLSILEHSFMTVRLITNRAVSHQLVRHRTGIVFSQESQRYCTYKGHIQFIMPERLETLRKYVDSVFSQKMEHIYEVSEVGTYWVNCCIQIENMYHNLLKMNLPAEDSRGVLGNDAKTEIIVTANLREWRYIFDLRTSKKCQYNMRVLMSNLLADAKKCVPLVFDDIGD